MSDLKEVDAELFFSALADRTRLRLLNLLRGGEVCVCFFAEALDTNNPKISRHLAYLKRAHLVKGRRDGKWVHYSLTFPKNKILKDIFNASLKLGDNDPQMSADRERLRSLNCSPDQFVSIGRSV